jgi:hypothetical protein
LYRIVNNVTEKTAEEINKPPPPPVLPQPPVRVMGADGGLDALPPGAPEPNKNPDLRPTGVGVAEPAVQNPVVGKREALLGETSDVPFEIRQTADDRDARTEAYAAALLLLWQRLQAGEITRQEYDGEVAKLIQQQGDAIIEAIARQEDVTPEQVRQGTTGGMIAGLLGKAMLGASAFAVAGVISDAMANAKANMASGAIWAAEHVAESGAKAQDQTATWVCLDDPASCDDCSALNGEEWAVADIPQFPGDGGTQCLGNCRCTLDYS